MSSHRSSLSRILDQLEGFYGPPKPPQSILRSLNGRGDPYEMILYTNCGYPATDAACMKGFELLKKGVGLEPQKILAAPEAKLLAVARKCGMLPEVRVQRWREIAARVKHEFGGDLHSALKKPLPEAKKAIKLFPTIGDPGADKILLFTKTAPIAAVPNELMEWYVHKPLTIKRLKQASREFFPERRGVPPPPGNAQVPENAGFR